MSGTMTFVNVRIMYLYLYYPITVNSVKAVIAQGGYISNVRAISYNVNAVTTSRVFVQGIAVDDGAAISGTTNTVWCICIGT